MILRPFVPNDWPVLSTHLYPGMPEAEAKTLIYQWNAGQYNGQFFAQLAVVAQSRIVGYVSLLETAPGTVSEGIEILPDQRRNGLGSEALRMLLSHVKNLGYRIITAQVRQDNTASLMLHKKLGFVITEEFINKRGHPVYTLSLNLS